MPLCLISGEHQLMVLVMDSSSASLSMVVSCSKELEVHLVASGLLVSVLTGREKVAHRTQ